MDQGTLVMDTIEAGAEFIREFDKYAPVKAAFWLKASDEDRRYLYIACDGMPRTGTTAAYREVVRVAGKLPSPFLDVFRIKLIDSDDPLARNAIDIQTRFPESTGKQFGGRFGGIIADDLYIYPLPIPAVTS